MVAAATNVLREPEEEAAAGRRRSPAAHERSHSLDMFPAEQMCGTTSGNSFIGRAQEAAGAEGSRPLPGTFRARIKNAARFPVLFRKPPSARGLEAPAPQGNQRGDTSVPHRRPAKSAPN